MTSKFFPGWRVAAKALALACAAGTLLAACGGGGGSGAPFAALPTANAGGDGAAAPQVPIVSAPGNGAESGADVPVRNSRLDCAP